MITMMRVCGFALGLTPTQARAALGPAGAARTAHDWALARPAIVAPEWPGDAQAGRGADQKTPLAGQVAGKPQPTALT